MCCAILQWLLQLPGLQVPEDAAKPGERSIANQSRRIHTLFGQIEIRRTYYYHAIEHRGRFPLDEAIGLIDGYTPAVACLIGRCAAEHSFQQAEASFFAYTGLKVEARQFPRMAEYLGPLAERFLRADLRSHEPRPPRVYVATDGTGAPLRKKELQGRKGRQPDGSAKTHEIKVAAPSASYNSPPPRASGPCIIAATSTTTIPAYTFRPRKRTDGAVWRFRQPSASQQKLSRRSHRSRASPGTPRGLRGMSARCSRPPQH